MEAARGDGETKRERPSTSGRDTVSLTKNKELHKSRINIADLRIKITDKYPSKIKNQEHG